MASKLVNNLGKLGVRVAAATSDPERNDKAMRGLIERCADVVPEGTTSLTLAEAQFFVGRQIELEIATLRRGDNEHVRKLVGVDALRQARNEAATEVYGSILRTRGAFEAVFGPGSSKKLLGLETRVPVDPEQLFQMGDRCRTWLRNPEIVLPAVDLPGFAFDREAMAAGIDGPLDRLGTALAALPQEQKHSVDTLAVKLAGLQRLDELIGRGARWLEALYDVAGMEAESDRVRLSSHQASRPAPEAEPAESQPDESPETAASESASPESPEEAATAT